MTKNNRLIAASMLSADFTNIRSSVEMAQHARAAWLHMDVMDGHFVPPITFGTQMVREVKKITKLPLDVHLMVNNPGFHVPDFIDAGSDMITFHIEAEIHAQRLLCQIREAGIKAGIAIVPSTPISAIVEILDVVDLVLVMTVNPGYGGQKLILSTLEKIRHLTHARDALDNKFLIMMDGGFNLETAKSVWNAGVDVAVMGSAFYGSHDPVKALKDCIAQV